MTQKWSSNRQNCHLGGKRRCFWGWYYQDSHFQERLWLASLVHHVNLIWEFPRGLPSFDWLCSLLRFLRVSIEIWICRRGYLSKFGWRPQLASRVFHVPERLRPSSGRPRFSSAGRCTQSSRSQGAELSKSWSSNYTTRNSCSTIWILFHLKNRWRSFMTLTVIWPQVFHWVSPRASSRPCEAACLSDQTSARPCSAASFAASEYQLEGFHLSFV